MAIIHIHTSFFTFTPHRPKGKVITLPFGVLWSVLYVVYVDGCLLALVTGVLELVYLQPLALRKNVHQSWPLALSYE